MTYTIKKGDEEDELIDAQGRVVYQWDGSYQWPDPDAIEAMIDDAGIDDPQKSFFEVLLLGPEIYRDD